MASRTLSLGLYNALLPAGLLFMAPSALIKMRRRGGDWRDFGQRLGFWSQERRRAIASLSQERLIWMHAVSVGEIGVARKLILEMLRQKPTQGIILTSTTPTGHRLALELEKDKPGNVVALYSPLDLPFVAARVLDELRPGQIVLVEAEVWPNMVTRAQAAGIPVTLVNARLSPRSERRYRRFHGLIAPVFGALSRVMVQEPADVDRWAALGVQRDRIVLTGSIKYDPHGSAVSAEKVVHLQQMLVQCGLAGRRLLLAASTHAGEEMALAKVYQELAGKVEGIGLLVVPRHYERGGEVTAELEALGLKPLRRSLLNAASSSRTDVLVIDSTGELRAWQELATIVIVGKSFLAEGGQNPAEAVMAGKPVVFGPHMENFEPLVKLLLDAKGAMQVRDFEALEQGLHGLLSDPRHRDEMAQAGQAALQKHDGATRRTACALLHDEEKLVEQPKA